MCPCEPAPSRELVWCRHSKRPTHLVEVVEGADVLLGVTGQQVLDGGPVARLALAEVVEDFVQRVVGLRRQHLLVLDQTLVNVGHLLQRHAHRRLGDQRGLAVLVHAELDLGLFHLVPAPDWLLLPFGSSHGLAL